MLRNSGILQNLNALRPYDYVRLVGTAGTDLRGLQNLLSWIGLEDFDELHELHKHLKGMETAGLIHKIGFISLFIKSKMSKDDSLLLTT